MEDRIPRLVVALDFPTAAEAVELAKRIEPHVDGFKVGLELLMGPGPGVVAAVGELGKPVFCDAKLHDIPNTVQAAARQLGRYGVRWVTAHAAGGRAMLEAAVEGLNASTAGSEGGILAITVLTSLDAATLAATGITTSVGRQVSRLSRLAAESGAEGVVCGVSELGTVAQVAPELLTATPGIRPSADSGADDQARISTPEEATRRGSDLLVVGRPITRAPDPLEAAARIAATIATTRQSRLVESDDPVESGEELA